jgi:hypothetical protein
MSDQYRSDTQEQDNFIAHETNICNDNNQQCRDLGYSPKRPRQPLTFNARLPPLPEPPRPHRPSSGSL